MFDDEVTPVDPLVAIRAKEQAGQQRPPEPSPPSADDASDERPD